MDKAIIFKDGSKILVSATDIKDGLYDGYDNQFVDPEYEFRVQYVKGAKNHGNPYFRLYYSYEDYKKKHPDRADRYAIVADMRRYDESRWHKKWKENVCGFCEIEKCIKDPVATKWKFADAFNPRTNTCIEFQHSYIAFDFEERNDFYSKLGINIVWLYDLPKATVREIDEGMIEILEDNARGFFRISENPDNLKNYPVYIQVKSGMIYRVTELTRREICSELKSSIRVFKPSQILSEEQFIDLIRTNVPQAEVFSSLYEIWEPYYNWVVVEDTTNQNTFLINRDKKGNMFRSFDSGFIQYKYVTCYTDGKNTRFTINSSKEYSLSHRKAESKIWKLVSSSKST